MIAGDIKHNPFNLAGDWRMVKDQLEQRLSFEKARNDVLKAQVLKDDAEYSAEMAALEEQKAMKQGHISKYSLAK